MGIDVVDRKILHDQKFVQVTDPAIDDHAAHPALLHSDAGHVAEKGRPVDRAAKLNDDHVTGVGIFTGPDVVLEVPVPFLRDLLRRGIDVRSQGQIAHGQRPANQLRPRLGEPEMVGEVLGVALILHAIPERFDRILRDAGELLIGDPRPILLQEIHERGPRIALRAQPGWNLNLRLRPPTDQKTGAESDEESEGQQ